MWTKIKKLKYDTKKEISRSFKWDINGVLNNTLWCVKKKMDQFYPKINVKVLLINVAKDQVYQKKEGQELEGSIEKSVALWIKETNHFHEVEKEKTIELISKNLEVNPLNNTIGDIRLID